MKLLADSNFLLRLSRRIWEESKFTDAESQDSVAFDVMAAAFSKMESCREFPDSQLKDIRALLKICLSKGGDLPSRAFGHLASQLPGLFKLPINERRSFIQNVLLPVLDFLADSVTSNAIPQSCMRDLEGLVEAIVELFLRVLSADNDVITEHVLQSLVQVVELPRGAEILVSRCVLLM